MKRGSLGEGRIDVKAAWAAGSLLKSYGISRRRLLSLTFVWAAALVTSSLIIGHGGQARRGR